MLRVNRPPLPPAAQKRLDYYQAELDQPEMTVDRAWANFKNAERKAAKKGEMTVLGTLQAMSFGKCAYCEQAQGDQVEHYLPKKPDSRNQNRGNSANTFYWDNLLPSCGRCNGASGKGSHMEWGEDGRPKLLNPCHDEPLDYLRFQLEVQLCGWVDPVPTNNIADNERSEYTIKLLKLNTRDDLRQARAEKILNFLGWLKVLSAHGPEHESPEGYLLRQRFLDFLAPQTPCLAPIRQILHSQPALQAELVYQIPELSELLAQWNLPNAG